MTSTDSSASTPYLQWEEQGQSHQARWHSESAAPPPRRVTIADDRMTADRAIQLASEGTAMLWRGDYQNACLLLQAMKRRLDRRPQKPVATVREQFNQHRLRQAQRSQLLRMVLLPFQSGHQLPLRRAPDIAAICEAVYGPADEPYVVALHEVLGMIGAHEWQKKGVLIAALQAHIHPRYGVFAPVRGEYVDLVAQAPLPSNTRCAFDIGTGTGVLAAVLAQRGVQRIIATDQDERALACAQDNLRRLGYAEQVEVVRADLYPQERASLIVCNPPWLPGRPSSPLEFAVYDPNSRMLKGFLKGLPSHLEPDGEGWLIISDLAEHLELRSRDELLAEIDKAGLRVVDRLDTRPSHPKAQAEDDPLHVARAAEVTSLWRLALQ